MYSKIQLRNFEVGEFGNIGVRTLDETSQLIRDFPWDTERGLASVELHCPSVTLEHPSGSFLKIGPYFGGKFCFYHCSKGGKVTFIVIRDFTEMAPIVSDFFNGDGKVKGFKKYKYIIMPLQYFKTNPFEYKPGSKAIFNYLKWDFAMIIMLIFIVFTRFFTDWSLFYDLIKLGTILGFLLIFFGPSLYLLFDYQAYYKNQYLRISRGHQNFIFGDLNGRKEYNKADILEICRYYHHGSRNPWNGSQVYKLVFKDGYTLVFSSLLISQLAFAKKFPGIEIKSEHVFFPTMANVFSKQEQ